MGSLKKIIKKNLDVIIIFVLVFSVKFFVVDIKYVSGKSMYPTLNSSKSTDKVLFNRLERIFNNYDRGDVVIIKKSDVAKDRIIKRVIAIEGDSVEIKEGYVFLNGKKLIEEYVKENGTTYLTNINVFSMGKKTVPEGSVFVLGDNRTGSSDSRNYGFFKYDDILGHAFIRFNIKNFEWGSL